MADLRCLSLSSLSRFSAGKWLKPLGLTLGLSLAWTQLEASTGLAQDLPGQTVADLFPADSPVQILGGDVDVDIQFDFAGGGTLPLEGEIDLSAVSVGVEGLPLPLTHIQGTVLVLSGGEQISIPALEANYDQIPIFVSGILGIGEGENAGLDLEIQIPTVSVAQLQQGFGLTLPVEAVGEFQANLRVGGTLEDPQITGEVRSLSAGRLDAVPLRDLRAQFAVIDQQVQIQPIQLRLAEGQVQGSAQIQLGPQPSVQGSLDLQGVNLDALASRYQIEVPYSLGTLNAQAQISAPQLQPSGSVQWQFGGGQLQGRGQITYQDGIFNLPQTQILVGQGQGQIDLQGRWASGLLEAVGHATAVDLSFFRSNITGIATAQITANGEITGPSLAGLTLQGTVTLPQGVQTQVGGQTAGITQPILSQLAWNGSSLQLDQVQLGELGQAQGQIAIDPTTFEIGALDLALTIPEFDLQQLTWPETLGIAGRVALSAQVAGSLQAPEVRGQLALANFEAVGLAFADLQGPVQWFPAASGGGLDLQSVPPDSPDQIRASVTPDLQQIDLSIRQALTEVTGSRSRDQAQITIAQFPLRSLGSLAGYPEAIGGALSGDLALNIPAQTAQGQIALDRLQLGQIEASGLGVDFAYQNGVLGITEANLQLFESLYQASGTITLPLIATLLAQIPVENSLGSEASAPTATVSQDPIPQVDLQISATEDGPASASTQALIPQLDLQISTTQSRLQDIISTFKWQTWEDVTRRGLSLPPQGPAQILDPTQAKGVPRQPLVPQIQEYLRVLAQHRQAKQSQAISPLPPPTSIQGEFSTQARMTGSLRDPLVDLSFEGRNWQAEEFVIESVIAEGSYQRGTLTLQPLSLSTGDRSTSFSGQLGLDQQSGELQVVGFPLGILQRFLPDAVTLTGDLKSQIQLAGNLRDPQIDGNFNITDTQVNGVPIQEASGQLAYDAGIWSTDSHILVTQAAQPLVISGTVSYTIPIPEVQADSHPIDLALRIDDQALQLINGFTDQVTWQAGESQIDVTVRGTLQDPLIQGDLVVSGGVVQVAAVEEPIRDLTGRIDFNTSLLEVPELQAQIGGGTVTGSGQLPINSRGAFGQRGQFQPLTLQLNQIDVTVPNRFQGQINGSVQVGGILTRPLIGGQVLVSEATVDVGPGESTSPAPTPVDPPPSQGRFDITGVEAFQTPLFQSPHTVSSESSDQQAAVIPLQLSDFQVGLRENVFVGYRRLFSFGAQGDLMVGGDISDLSTLMPDGTIFLRGGGINLPIGGGFRLSRDQTNSARFDPQNGLDPFLDLLLINRITEVSSPPITDSLAGGDLDPTLVSSQTIEIEARILGRASELASSEPTDVIELTSTPARSEDEILNLLATTTLATFGSGRVFLEQSGNDVLGTLGGAVGLDEVLINPVFQVESGASNVSNVGLQLQLIKDLTRSLSVSSGIPLTEDQPTRYNARYRINSDTLLRLSTDLEGNESATVDFGIRF